MEIIMLSILSQVQKDTFAIVGLGRRGKERRMIEHE
jgi:hypothetical protein